MFAFDNWVLVDCAGRSVQRQVGTRRELASVLATLGLSPDESSRTASSLWQQRPSDAAGGDVRTREAAWKGTGLGPVEILAVLAMFVILAVVAFAFFFSR